MSKCKNGMFAVEKGVLFFNIGNQAVKNSERKANDRLITSNINTACTHGNTGSGLFYH